MSNLKLVVRTLAMTDADDELVTVARVKLMYNPAVLKKERIEKLVKKVIAQLEEDAQVDLSYRHKNSN